MTPQGKQRLLDKRAAVDFMAEAMLDPTINMAEFALQHEVSLPHLVERVRHTLLTVSNDDKHNFGQQIANVRSAFAACVHERPREVK